MLSVLMLVVVTGMANEEAPPPLPQSPAQLLVDVQDQTETEAASAGVKSDCRCPENEELIFQLDQEAEKNEALIEKQKATIEKLTNNVVEMTVAIDALKDKLRMVKGKKLSTDGFGKAKWGMSLRQVKRRYPGLTKNGKNAYVKKASIAGMSAVRFFQFDAAKLTLAGYVITEKFSNNKTYIEQFRKLQQLLSSKYGDPIDARAVWSNEVYRAQPEHVGLALSQGYVKFYATWDTGKTGIELGLHGNNYQIQMHVRYHSVELEGLRSQIQQAAHLEDL